MTFLVGFYQDFNEFQNSFSFYHIFQCEDASRDIHKLEMDLNKGPTSKLQRNEPTFRFHNCSFSCIADQTAQECSNLGQPIELEQADFARSHI